MNDKESLSRHLLTSAIELRKECLKVSGHDTVTVQPDIQAYRGPELSQPWDLPGVKGSDIVRSLYGVELKPKEIFFVWDRAITLLAKGEVPALHDWLKAAQPAVPFSGPTKISTAAVMVQFLVAISWYCGDLDISPGEAILWVDRIPLGFTRTIVRGFRQQHRLRRATPLLSGISIPLGRKVWCSRDTAAVHQHLLSVLPGRRRMIDLTVSAAVYSGRDYERLITDRFNIDPFAEKSVGPVNNLLKLQRKARWA